VEDIGYPCWDPSGVQSLSRSYPGGIPRYRGLNHRLMALNPPGSLLIVVPKDLHPFNNVCKYSQELVAFILKDSETRRSDYFRFNQQF